MSEINRDFLPDFYDQEGNLFSLAERLAIIRAGLDLVGAQFEITEDEEKEPEDFC